MLINSRTRGTRVMSEPWSLLHLHGMRNAGLMEEGEEMDRLVRAAVLLQCKEEEADGEEIER